MYTTISCPLGFPVDSRAVALSNQRGSLAGPSKEASKNAFKNLQNRLKSVTKLSLILCFHLRGISNG